MQPPGKRINPGLRSASSCTKSARNPPGRFFHVSFGNNEIISASYTPLPSNHTLSLALGSVAVAVNSTAYFFQSLPEMVTEALPSLLPVGEINSARMVPVVPSTTREIIEKVYPLSFLMPMPLNPSLVIANGLSLSFTLILAKRGLEGFSTLLFKINIFPFLSFSTFQPISGCVNSKERFFTNSAYNPPSAARLMSSKKIPHIVG